VAHLVIVLLCSGLGRTSYAQDASPPVRTPPSEALEHYSRGRAHYQAGRYREAVVELERALALDPSSPNLVYNLARVHELLGDIAPSIGYYERYSAMLPASEQEERQRVAGVIARLRGARTQLARPAPEEDRSHSQPLVLRTERGVADGAFWTVATLSLAGLAAGAVTGYLALRKAREGRRFVLGLDGDNADRLALADKADRFAYASDGCLAFGAIGGLTAILLYALRSKPVVQPQLSVLRGGGALVFVGEL
jgi:tetratricopeptide (TPR) repeat protein